VSEAQWLKETLGRFGSQYEFMGIERRVEAFLCRIWRWWRGKAKEGAL
jgi:hypothetical protein